MTETHTQSEVTGKMLAVLERLRDGRFHFVGPDESVSRYMAARLEAAGLVMWVRGRTWDVGASRVQITQSGRDLLGACPSPETK